MQVNNRLKKARKCRSRCVNQRRKKLKDTGNPATYRPWQKLVTAVECQKCCAVGCETTEWPQNRPKRAIFPQKKPIPHLFHRMALEPPIPRPVLQSGTGDSLDFCTKTGSKRTCMSLFQCDSFKSDSFLTNMKASVVSEALKTCQVKEQNSTIDSLAWWQKNIPGVVAASFT